MYMRLSNFFKTPSCWTQDCLAIDTDDKVIDFNAYNEETMKNRRIKAMSLHGAIGYFFNFEKEPERRNRIMMNIRKAISSIYGKNYFIAEFNNLESTRFEDIVKVVKLAEKM